MNSEEKDQTIVDLRHSINVCNRNLFFVKVYLRDRTTAYIDNINYPKLKEEYLKIINSELLITEKDDRLDEIFNNIQMKLWDTITVDEILYAQDELLKMLIRVVDMKDD